MEDFDNQRGMQRTVESVSFYPFNEAREICLTPLLPPPPYLIMWMLFFLESVWILGECSKDKICIIFVHRNTK